MAAAQTGADADADTGLGTGMAAVGHADAQSDAQAAAGGNALETSVGEADGECTSDPDYVAAVRKGVEVSRGVDSGLVAEAVEDVIGEAVDDGHVMATQGQDEIVRST
jgi:hypothetical protein